MLSVANFRIRPATSYPSQLPAPSQLKASFMTALRKNDIRTNNRTPCQLETATKDKIEDVKLMIKLIDTYTIQTI